MIKQFINKTTAIVLAFVLLANNINTIVIVTDFVINQDIIAKTLCIQKEAQKGCLGKCQLRKELAKNNSTSDSDSPFNTVERMQLDQFLAYDLISLKNHFQSVESTSINIILRKRSTSQGFFEVDTPPPNLV
ncbi:hypothetical protein [Winogradskyella sp.]|uniref:hypothetical protein n=1 Tax=Winogradskyella sp. TaxID=1883156 RepID=UPI003BAA1C98